MRCLPALLMALLLLGGCASQPAVMRYHVPAEPLVWPQAPEPPRYRLSGILTGEDNFHRPSSSAQPFKQALAWVVGLVLGEEVPRRLQKPISGLFDARTGRIYVVDMGQRAVFVFDPVVGRVSIWRHASVDAGFVAPVAIAPGPAGELWVTDAERGRITRLDAQGNVLGEVGAGVLQRPTGIARDEENGRIFVADTRAHDIKVFADDGRLLARWGKRGEQAGQFNGPTHLAFADGRLYVADTLNSRVQVFSGAGEWLRSFGRRGLYFGDTPRPKGVALDGAGRVYVVESYYDYLLVYDAEGRLLLPLGGTGSKPGQFYLPAGVWTDGGNRVFVADMFNGRVVSFEYIGEDATASGGGGQ